MEKRKNPNDELKWKIEYIKTIGEEIPKYTKFMMEKTYFLLFITSIFLLTIINIMNMKNNNLKPILIILFLSFAILFSLLTILSVDISRKKNMRLSNLFEEIDKNKSKKLDEEDIINLFLKIYSVGENISPHASKILLGINLAIIILWSILLIVLLYQYQLILIITLIVLSFFAIFLFSFYNG